MSNELATQDTIERLKRLESKVCNLASFLGCRDLSKESKLRATERVVVNPGRIVVTTQSTSVGEMVLALHGSGLTGHFDITMAGNYFGRIIYNPEEN